MPVTGRLKGYFLRGMAVLLPAVLTIWIFVLAYTFIQDNISVHINRGLVKLIVHFKGEEWISQADLTKILVDGKAGSIVGFVIAVVGVCLVGAILASVFGRALWRMIEGFILNTPVFRRVYPYIKQVTDFLLAPEQQRRLSFSRVVAVEYPRKGIWSLGLVTGSGLKNVTESVRKEFLTVLVPTSPTPFTGFVIMLPKKTVIDLEMTVEEAFRFLISGGVITPAKGKDMPVLSSSELDSQD
ncbi:MAG: DUF502 domain-containing protein [Sedimentisphaerales bacterium]|nr:DUF502 domain-containing protein [Sedimentisphaerales bacterium]